MTPGVPVARRWACSCGPPGNGTPNQGVVYYDLWQARLWWLFGVGVSCFRKCVLYLWNSNMMDFNGFNGKGLKELEDTSAHVLARWDEMPRDEFGVPAHIPPELSTTIRHTCRGRCHLWWQLSVVEILPLQNECRNVVSNFCGPTSCIASSVFFVISTF